MKKSKKSSAVSSTAAEAPVQASSPITNVLAERYASLAMKDIWSQHGRILLERDFWGLLGFRMRVRVFDIRGDRISGGEVLVETSAGTHDNLEGLAVWRDRQGTIRLTMISDDNQRFFQRTEFVEYRVRAQKP